MQYLEHVQCRISLKYFSHGNLKLVLASPRGTRYTDLLCILALLFYDRSSLLLPRPKDKLATSFEDWPFLSVHYWGEDPTGEWTLEIANAAQAAKAPGLLKHWQLVLYGTEKSPVPESKPSPAVPGTATQPAYTGEDFSVPAAEQHRSPRCCREQELLQQHPGPGLPSSVLPGLHRPWAPAVQGVHQLPAPGLMCEVVSPWHLRFIAPAPGGTDG